jgi:hypothetical protein
LPSIIEQLYAYIIFINTNGGQGYGDRHEYIVSTENLNSTPTIDAVKENLDKILSEIPKFHNDLPTYKQIISNFKQVAIIKLHVLYEQVFPYLAIGLAHRA